MFLHCVAVELKNIFGVLAYSKFVFQVKYEHCNWCGNAANAVLEIAINKKVQTKKYP
jgi:hypothetical protein